MLYDQTPLLKSSTTDFERAAMERFSHLAACLPRSCQVFREPWGQATVVCLNFAACSEQLAAVQAQLPALIAAAQQLGLTNSLVFKIGNQVISWHAIADS